MFQERGLLPLPPVEHTKLRGCTSVSPVEKNLTPQVGRPVFSEPPCLVCAKYVLE